MMSQAVENLVKAQQDAIHICPRVGGFPYFAEVLRRAGVTQNSWHLPSCQSIYLTKCGPVVNQGTPLVHTTVDVPAFDQEALITALRTDQAGESSFIEFLKAIWEAGVVNYSVDFEKRQVIYYGVLGESYSEKYPAVQVD